MEPARCWPCEHEELNPDSQPTRKQPMKHVFLFRSMYFCTWISFCTGLISIRESHSFSVYNLNYKQIVEFIYYKVLNLDFKVYDNLLYSKHITK